ncbi:MAG: hypothetical protein OSA47_03305 [Novosphingopyxis baekryungensis]|nr:hypothetical protein [Novosphingopyxis baekryungensis]
MAIGISACTPEPSDSGEPIDAPDASATPGTLATPEAKATSDGSMATMAKAPASEAKTKPGLDNLCAPGEKVLFSCSLENGKMASVCAAAQIGGARFAQYRYGVQGEESELVYPKSRQDGAIRFVSVPYSGGGEAQLIFERGDTTYVVYSNVIRTGFDEGGNKPEFNDGLSAMRGDKTIADHQCKSDGLMSIDSEKARKYAKVVDGDDIVMHD